ncbi:MAG TPA: sugar-binding transcriptional regulator [Firmicutes bacterium]|nr:sugar-binding transcriptional regulator [Bacillota bacterium]
MPNSRNLAYRAAYLYYVEGLPQKEVAARLALSTPTVSRLLRRAREEGLVQIFLRDPYADYYSLEERLRVKYGLQDVIIAHIPKETPVHLAKTAIAKEGAEYLQRVLRDGDLVGIAWGSTVYELVESLDLSGVARANWVALHGSLSRIPYQHDVVNLVRVIAHQNNGSNYFLNTEGILDNPQTAAAVRRESALHTVFELHRKITVAVVGIGAFYPEATSSLVTAGYVTPQDLAEFRRAGVVGDMVLRFFDREGKECSTSLVARTLSVELGDYRRIPKKIAVAGGLHKAVAVQAALHGGLVDVLVTDPVLAEQISQHPV